MFRFGVFWLAASASGLSEVELLLSRALWIPAVAASDVVVAFMPLVGYRCWLLSVAPRSSAVSPSRVLSPSELLTAAGIEGGIWLPGLQL